MTEDIILQNWATTSNPEFGKSLREFMLNTLNDVQVEFVPGCNDSPCLTTPIQTLRQGITAMMALIEDLTTRIEVLEGP